MSRPKVHRIRGVVSRTPRELAENGAWMWTIFVDDVSLSGDDENAEDGDYEETQDEAMAACNEAGQWMARAWGVTWGGAALDSTTDTSDE